MYCSIEWLNKELALQPDRESRKNILVIFLTTAADFLVEDCHEVCLRLIEDAEKEKDNDLLAIALLYISFRQRSNGEQVSARETFERVLQLFPTLRSNFTSMIISQMIAFEYWGQGKRDLGFEYAFRSLKLGEHLAGEGRGWANFQLGVFYYDLKDHESSLRYFHEAEKDAIRENMTYQLARINSGIGSIHIAKNELDEAFACNQKALEGYRQVGHQTAVSRALNDLGVISMREGKTTEAERFLEEALGIRRRLNYFPGMITTLLEMARLYNQTGKIEDAGKLLKEALELCDKTSSKQKAAVCHLMLADFYKAKNDPWKALEQVEAYNRVRFDLAGEETSNRIQHLTQKFATEKSEQEAEIHRLKNVELAALNAQIEEKNKSILDSIHYAKRIQESLLPSEFLIARNLERLIALKP